MLSSNPVIHLSRTNTSRSHFFTCREPLWNQKLVDENSMIAMEKHNVRVKDPCFKNLTIFMGLLTHFVHGKTKCFSNRSAPPKHQLRPGEFP